MSALWRVELLHPLIVHFAVGWLVLATALAPLRWAVPDRYRQPLIISCRVLLALGLFAGWGAVWSGQEAYSEIAGTLCVPNVADAHEWYGTTALWLFTVGLAADLTADVLPGSPIPRTLLTSASILLLFAGATFLFQAGERGAHLVYEQGAAVNAPGEDCSRFEP